MGPNPTQAHPPTDAEQCLTLRTANAGLRVRVEELEKAKDAWRGVAEQHEATIQGLRGEVDALRKQLNIIGVAYGHRVAPRVSSTEAATETRPLEETQL